MSKRVIVVDDENIFLELVPKILKSLDLGLIITATNIQDAWTAIEDSPPVLVITDFNMPGGSGFELCRWIKNKYLDLPVILTTGEIKLPTPDPLYAPDRILTKPYTAMELREVVTTLLKK